MVKTILKLLPLMVLLFEDSGLTSNGYLKDV